MASPFEDRQKREADQQGPKGPSVQEALSVIRGALDSPKGQAALRTVEAELEHRGPLNREKKTSKGSEPPQKGRAPQMPGRSAKGAGNSPFVRRQERARTQATARSGA